MTSHVGKVYTTTVKHDPIDDEYYIEFEGAMLTFIAEQGWKVGDELEWHLMDNRSAVLLNRSLYEREEAEKKKEEENDNSI